MRTLEEGIKITLCWGLLYGSKGHIVRNMVKKWDEVDTNEHAPCRKKSSSGPRLEPGEDSIDRSTPKKGANGIYTLSWQIRPNDGGPKTRHTTTGPSKNLTRRRAKARADEIRQIGENNDWSLSDTAGEFIAKISINAIQELHREPSTKTRYATVMRCFLGTCPRAEEHQIAFGSMTIGKAILANSGVEVLRDIAKVHGAESGHQAKTVLTRYIYDLMRLHGLVDHNPIAGVRIEWPQGSAHPTGRGGVSLGLVNYRRCVAYLLSLDPATDMSIKKKGRWKPEDRIARRRNAINLILLQMGTAMRVEEANSLHWSDVVFESDAGGSSEEITMSVLVSVGRSKTHRSRRIPVINQRVARHFKELHDLDEASGVAMQDMYVIGAPADRKREWDPSNRNKALREMYLNMAGVLEIPDLKIQCGHVWRATINTILRDRGVGLEVRAAMLGHSAVVNRTSYTDTTDMSPLEGVSL